MVVQVTALVVEVQHFNSLPFMTVSGISCCTGRQKGTLDAREPGREFASWTLAPVLLFTASCSSNFSRQSQQGNAVMACLAPACGSSGKHNQNDDFSKSVTLYEVAVCTGASWILSVHVYSLISKEIRLAVKCFSCPFIPEKALSDPNDFLQIPLFPRGMRIHQIRNCTKKAIGTQVTLLFF